MFLSWPTVPATRLFPPRTRLTSQRAVPSRGSPGRTSLPVRLHCDCCPSHVQGAVIATITPESWAYAEGFLAEDSPIALARRRGHEVGAIPIGPGGGCALRILAAAIDARTVVEVGTGAGVSGLYLLAGMRADGVLTSIDIESEHQRLAREAFAEAGIGHNRTRLITGAAMDVLPRLTDGAYDLVFCDGDKAEYGDYLQQAVRLLRTGGVVAFDNALWHDRVADPAQRDPDTVAIRELGRAVRDDERLLPALLPVGDGLLVAVKREPPDDQADRSRAGG